MQQISLHRDNKVVLYCMDTKTERTGKCNVPQNANGYPGKDKDKYQVWTDWEVQYTHMRMGIQEKTSKDIET